MGYPAEKKSSVILRAEKLTRNVSTESKSHTIIDSFNYEFKRGGVYTIVGPSGSGKTSLLRLFNRLDEKTEGEVYFENRSIIDYPVAELRRNIVLVFQIPYLFPGSIAGNLAYCCGRDLAANQEFTARYLNLVGLEPDLADTDPEKLSVGQKQRVALARALVLDPKILLLDEPTSALDPGAARTIEELILKLNEELGLTIIMVTHNFRQAQRLRGMSIFIVGGSLVESGPSETIFSQPTQKITQRFIKGDLR